jgi:putative SOS response-associated peptidase YedK
MAFAGLWEGFKWPDSTVTRAFTIITTYANDTVGGLHDRMPVILEPEDWPTWLGEIESAEAGWRGCAEGLAGQQADD